MEDGKVLFTTPIDTANPIDCLPRYFHFVHALGSPVHPYSAEGKYRSAEVYCVFHYTLRGHGECWQGGRRERVSPGQGFLMRINDPTSGYRFPGDMDEEWEFIVFCFYGGNCMDIVREMNRRYGLVYPVSYRSPAIQELADEERWKQEIPLSGFESGRLFYELYDELIRSAARKDPQQVDPVVRQVRHLVRRHLMENPSVDQIAAEAGFSREHLSRVFRRQTGKRLKEYMDEQRILLCCRMLKDSGHPVGELARQLSFSSPANFTRFFREHMHMTPLEFREKGTIPYF